MMKSKQTQDRLIVFTRYPEPGTTKTRLATALGDQGAADMHKRLTEQTVSQIRKLLNSGGPAVMVSHEGGSLKQMQQWLGPDLQYRHQGGGDLGKKMARAFAAAFKQGYKRIVIIGTDCPDLNADHIKQAFAALHRKDLVLGPARDGGYYLIGLRREEKSLFGEIPWGGDAVLATTLNLAAQKHLTADLLETLSDVDRPEDLRHISHCSDT